MEAGLQFKMKMKVLFFGLGSIGMRHAKLLLDHFDVDIAAYRSGNGQSLPSIREFSTLEDAFYFQPDIAFITNPTDLHIETAIACAERSIHLFIEKPLSNRIKGIDQLIRLIRKNNLVNHVAFCLRYHPVIKYLKTAVDHTTSYYSRTICSSYLPLWRPEQDYRKSYSADKSRGGGVIHELVHELDYNEYLFGKVNRMTKTSGKASNLEISAEDFSEIQLDHANGLQSHISIDFFSHLRERAIRIYYPDKVITGDIINRTVRIFREHELAKEITFDEENMYLNQLRSFFNAIDRKPANSLCSVEEAKNLVQLISKR
jgi:predicted dehydrogenase